MRSIFYLNLLKNMKIKKTHYTRIFMCLNFSNSTEFSVDNEIHQKFSRRRKITVPICSVVLFDQVSTGTPPTTECDITTIYTEVVNLKAVPQSLLISCSYICVCVELSPTSSNHTHYQSMCYQESPTEQNYVWILILNVCLILFFFQHTQTNKQIP